MSPQTPMCSLPMITPPPISHPKLLLSVVNRLLGVNSTWVLIRPRPARPYGRIGPIRGTNIALLITVSTLEFSVGAVPKKSLAYPNSSSKPNTLPIFPSDTPKFSRFSSQPVMFGQLASPPKLNPMKGLMKPWACDVAAQPTDRTKASTQGTSRTRKLFVIVAPGEPPPVVAGLPPP